MESVTVPAVLATRMVQMAGAFTVLYPIAASMLCITAALFFLLRWERPARRLARSGPPVSVLIYLQLDGAPLEQVLAAARGLDYREFEVIVIDDGAGTAASALAGPFIQAGQVRLLRKAVSEGRAMALNDALACANGEVVLLLDADVMLTPGVLKEIMPHFAASRVAAVMGNSRVWQPQGVLGRFQSMERAAIASLSGRAQRVVGRGSALPGTVLACRKTALQEIGGFDPQAACAEMDLTWRLQKRSWDVRFEPRAIAWRQATRGGGALLLQHLDAAVSLLQMLGRHADILRSRRCRRMWPLYGGACLALLWSLTASGMAIYWLTQAISAPRWLSGAGLPGPWGMTMFTLLLVQAGLGLWADRLYDPYLRGSGRYLVLFPALYWLFAASTLAAALPVCCLVRLLRRPIPADRRR